MQSQIDALIGEFFAAFDNRAGRKVDLTSLRSLFVHGALIVKNTATSSETLSVDAFIQPRQALLTNGSLVEFHEWEIDATTFIFDGIACRTLRYAKDGILNGAPFAGEGMKSIHLARTHEGWRITSIVWQDADAGLPIDAATWHGARW
jgi:hypothetical protein